MGNEENKQEGHDLEEVEGLVGPEIKEDELPEISLSPDDTMLGNTLNDAYEANSKKYSLSLDQTSDSNTYTTIIETLPSLYLGSVKKERKGVLSNKLEIIAKSPDFNRNGEMIINVLEGKNIGSYSFGGKYNKPKKLKKAYLNLIEEIKRKHIVTESLGLKLYPIDPKPQDSKSS